MPLVAASQLLSAIPQEALALSSGQQTDLRTLLTQVGALEQGYDAQAAALAPKPKHAPLREDPATRSRIAATAAADLNRINDPSTRTGDWIQNRGLYYRTNSFPPAIQEMLSRVATQRGRSVEEVSGDMVGDGYANSRYFEHCGAQGQNVRFRYIKKPGVSAYDAVHAFVGGFTVADCATSAMAIQLKAVAVEMGKAAFDKMFNDWTGPFIQPRLQGTPMAYFATAHSPVEKGAAPPEGDVAHVESGGKTWAVRPGDKAYVMNHIDYIKVDPGGLWTGEHVLCVGVEERDGKKVPLWSGFGLSAATAEKMLEEIAVEYARAALRNPTYLRDKFNMRNTGANEAVIRKKLMESFNSPSSKAGLKIDDKMLYSWQLDTGRVRHYASAPSR